MMADLEYLSLTPFQRFFYRIKKGFINFGTKVADFFKNLPAKLHKVLKALWSVIYIPYYYFRYGDWKTRLSFLLWGFSNFAHKQWLRGILFSAFEIGFILYLSLFGGHFLIRLPTLGTISPQEVLDPRGVPTGYFDNSFQILLFGILSLVIIGIAIFVFHSNIKQAYENNISIQINKKIASSRDDLRQVGNDQYHKTLLAFPMFGLVLFTVIPLIFMICIAFTNYDSLHYPPNELFGWIGLDNFAELINANGAMGGDAVRFSYTFTRVLGWTLIWAVIATFSCFIFGILLALIINKKGIRLKKLWRNILIVTIAVPQFVSLLLMSKMLRSSSDLQGIYNSIFMSIGLKPIDFLTDGTIAKITVLVVNLWVGVPFTVLSVSGILMNIPEDLYEAARIDGANPYRMFMKITLPYTLFVLGPSLITTFVSNINNFNVIYLLTNGGGPFPADGSLAVGAGDTSLLITWLYKLTVDESKYGIASAIGIVVFIICAVISLIVYSRSKAFKNEEDFQ